MSAGEAIPAQRNCEPRPRGIYESLKITFPYLNSTAWRWRSTIKLYRHFDAEATSQLWKIFLDLKCKKHGYAGEQKNTIIPRFSLVRAWRLLKFCWSLPELNASVRPFNGGCRKIRIARQLEKVFEPYGMIFKGKEKQLPLKYSCK
jgi:hypothetical protein